MAIPTNYIDKITKFGESRDICPAAGKVRVDNENFEGADLNEVLNEVAGAIDEAASGGYAPPEGGIPATDLTQDVQAILNDVANKVDKIPGKGLSTEDFTAALKSKLEALDPYTKAQVDAAIQEALSGYTPGETVVASVDDIDIVDNPNGANSDTILAAASARMVKEIYINVKALFQNLAGMAFVGDKPTWQTVPVRTYTIGMASADSNITLTDGNGNSVTSPQPEGTPLTLRLSAANGYRFAAAPTALMGSTEIEFALDGSYYVATIGALAGNIVITASSVEMGTYSVNIPTGAVFCTSTGAAASSPSIEEGEGVTCYIKPADGRRWATPPSSTGATITLQSDSIYKIVASNVQADITVSGSTEAIPTYAINLPSAGNGIASVALTDANNNAITSPVIEGTAVKIVLTPAANYSINVSSAKMGQQDLTPTNVNGVLTFTIASVTGAVVITAVAEEVGKVNVSYNLRNMVVSSDNTSNGQITEGGTLTAALATAPMTTPQIPSGSPSTLPLYGSYNGVTYEGEWSTPHVVVKKGGIEVQGAYNASTGVVTVANVDDEIEITAICEPKHYFSASIGGNSVSPHYPSSPGYDTSLPNAIGISSLYLKLPNTCTKVRWNHMTKNYNDTAWGSNMFLFTYNYTTKGNVWSQNIKESAVVKSGNRYATNYQDVEFTQPTNKSNYMYALARMFTPLLSQCFLVDITDVDAYALAALDAAAVAAYNTANGTSYTTADAIAGASLDDIVAIGGRIIFDGRYSEFMTDPNAE